MLPAAFLNLYLTGAVLEGVAFGLRDSHQALKTTHAALRDRFDAGYQAFRAAYPAILEIQQAETARPDHHCVDFPPEASQVLDLSQQRLLSGI